MSWHPLTRLCSFPGIETCKISAGCSADRTTSLAAPVSEDCEMFPLMASPWRSTIFDKASYSILPILANIYFRSDDGSAGSTTEAAAPVRGVGKVTAWEAFTEDVRLFSIIYAICDFIAYFPKKCAPCLQKVDDKLLAYYQTIRLISVEDVGFLMLCILVVFGIWLLSEILIQSITSYYLSI